MGTTTHKYKTKYTIYVCSTKNRRYETIRFKRMRPWAFLFFFYRGNPARINLTIAGAKAAAAIERRKIRVFENADKTRISITHNNRTWYNLRVKSRRQKQSCQRHLIPSSITEKLSKNEQRGGFRKNPARTTTDAV